MASFTELSDDEEKPRASFADLADEDEPAKPKGAVATAKPAVTGELPWYKRAAQGLSDPIVGAGQLMQNIVPDAAMNVARKAAGSFAGAVGADEFAQDLARPVSTDEFNQVVGGREGAYQGQRKAAGQEGLDWWRVGGTVANPMSWVGAGPAASVGGAAMKGAGTGAIQALMQPVTADGYAMNKLTQTAIGAGAGGALGAAFHGIGRAIAETLKSFKGKGAEAAAQKTDEILRSQGAEPEKVNPSVYAAIRDEVDDVLSQGVDPDPRVMFNRAQAASLPVPIRLTHGEASGDPMQRAWEHRVSGQEGVGERLAERITETNRALIENLNVLGARNAPSTFDTSQKLISHIEAVDAAAKARVDQAYQLVRDAEGRTARVSNEAFTERSKDLLTGGRPEMAELSSLADYLPEPLVKQYNAIINGKLPLTVDTVQFLDRNWGGIQRGAGDDTVKRGIGALRQALNEAPVSDQLGEQSMQAYKVARELAKQRFAAIESNPAYKAIDAGVEPDKFFQKYVQGANVRELAGLKQLVGAENTALLQRTFMGNLKDKVINGASEERGTFSHTKLNNVLRDEVQGPRLKELFSDSPEILSELNKLGQVAENIQRTTAGSRVNFSNTASQGSNIVRDVIKSEAGASLLNLIPGARVIREVGAKRTAEKAVDAALNPGVTSIPLKPPAPPAQVGRISELLTAAGAGGTSREMSTKREKRAND